MRLKNRWGISVNRNRIPIRPGVAAAAIDLRVERILRDKNLIPRLLLIKPRQQHVGILLQRPLQRLLERQSLSFSRRQNRKNKKCQYLHTDFKFSQWGRFPTCPPHYSYRSASVGFNRDALLAGKIPNTNPTPRDTVNATAIDSGEIGIANSSVK